VDCPCPPRVPAHFAAHGLFTLRTATRNLVQQRSRPRGLSHIRHVLLRCFDANHWRRSGEVGPFQEQRAMAMYPSANLILCRTSNLQRRASNPCWSCYPHGYLAHADWHCFAASGPVAPAQGRHPVGRQAGVRAQESWDRPSSIGSQQEAWIHASA